MKRKVAYVLLLACVNGCVVVPSNHFKGHIGPYPFDYTFRKDVDAKDLKVEAEVHTNGTAKISISVGSLTSHNNPAVIQTTGQAQVDLVRAVGEEVSKASGRAAGAAILPEK